MSYAGHCQLPRLLYGAPGVFNVIEHPSGAIFIVDRNRQLKVSTDDGTTWNDVPGSTGIPVRTDGIVMNAKGEIVFGTLTGSPSIYYATATSCTVATPSPLPSAVAGLNRVINAGNAGVMYAVGDVTTLIYRSVDYGHTWTNFNVTFPGGTIGHGYAAEWNAYGLMVAGEIGSLNLSTDEGATWTDWGLTRPNYHGNLWTINTHPLTGTVYATVPDPSPGTGCIQTHRIGDTAGTWRGASGFHSGTESLGFCFQRDGSILSGNNYTTPGIGEVWKSTDDGATWTEISAQIGVVLKASVRIHLGPSGRTYLSDANALVRKPSKVGY